MVVGIQRMLVNPCRVIADSQGRVAESPISQSTAWHKLFFSRSIGRQGVDCRLVDHDNVARDRNHPPVSDPCVSEI